MAEARLDRLILHIGCYKTGTSSIQYALHANRGRLAEAGIHYVKPAESEEAQKSPRQNFIKRWPAKKIARAFAGLQGTGILSLEDLWDKAALQEKAIAAVQMIAPRAVTVIGYCRPQVAFLQSWYAQELKYGAPYAAGRTPLQFLEHCEAMGTLSFRRAFARYEAAFGRDAILARAYARDRLEGGDSVQDFTTALGLPALDVPGQGARNPSFSRGQIEVARRLWHVVLSLADARGEPREEAIEAARKLVRRAAFSFEPSYDAPLYPPEVLEKLTSDYAAENRAFCRDHGIEAEGFLP